MADISPSGAATAIAIKDMRNVPASTGTEPNAPVEPTWSGLMATWGLHLSPNRNSCTGMTLKNLMDSKITDRTIPRVVKMAMVAQAMNRKFIPVSI